MDDLELIWNDILSRDPTRIRLRWQTFSPEEQAAIRAHLTRMVSEDGWTDGQRKSAEVALQTLDAPPDRS